MAATIGIVAAERISAGVVQDHLIKGALRVAPQEAGLLYLPASELCQKLCEISRETAESVSSVGIAVPGLVSPGGVIAECPHLAQLKGYPLADAMSQRLGVPVTVSEVADAVAAGIAASKGHLDRLSRVWMLGETIGYGRYPSGSEYWEGGHMVVTLDPHENYCPCGGVGHLESILGTRAMRLRFLDLDPEEVFVSQERRCTDFVRLWHRALAAATATSLHLEGPGRFFVSGPSARFLQVGLLYRYLDQMVKMSTLQDYAFEVVPESQELAVIGSVVSAPASAVAVAASA